ncbi:uncharacterized protein [Eurosta solidaginis]|uniref:uncharacterized protein n=1 Tax=Eurosta solidaginis TaxID=178769 RepID=UPI00353063FD
MSISANVGRSLSCVMQRLLPKSSLAATTVQSVKRLLSYRSDCANAKDGSEPKEKKEEKKSMWSNPECCLDPCPDVLPRLDDLYYKPSDKLKRKYTQTWVECPKVKYARKKVCCLQNIIKPPFKKRMRRRTKGKDGECIPGKTDLMPCKQAQPRSKCPRFILPGCNPARNPPKCKRQRYKVDCRKVCTPYPSFSECVKKKARRLRPIECRCLDIPSLCEVLQEMRRQASVKKVAGQEK